MVYPSESLTDRATRRSVAIRASRYVAADAWRHEHPLDIVTAHPKLPLGEEPPPESVDWHNRVIVRPATLTPRPTQKPSLHAVGYPRPRTQDGWPLPYTGNDVYNPCATDLRLEERCARERFCQVCGQPIPAGSAFAILRLGHHHRLAQGKLPWIEGRSLLDTHCLRLSLRWCPELIRQTRQGVADIREEPPETPSPIIEGRFLDPRRYRPLVVPVWPHELERDRGAPCAADWLAWAAGVNAKAAARLFRGTPTASEAPGEGSETIQ